MVDNKTRDKQSNLFTSVGSEVGKGPMSLDKDMTKSTIAARN